MKAFCLLLSITLSGCCCAEGAPLHNPPTSPVLSDSDPAPLSQDQQQLRQLVQKLSVFENQGAQLIQVLQNMARHQSLLVENNQALLLQTSRIASLLQDITKKAPEARQQETPSYEDKLKNPIVISKPDPRHTGTYLCGYTNQSLAHLSTCDPPVCQRLSMKQGQDFLFKCLLTDPSVTNLTLQPADIVQGRGRELPTGMRNKAVRIEGETFEVTCEGSSTTHLFNLTWVHLGKKNFDVATTRTSQNSQIFISSTLTISAVRHEDAGTYTCKGVNEDGVPRQQHNSELLVSEFLMTCSVLGRRVSIYSKSQHVSPFSPLFSNQMLPS
ncbi:unnamed protein product [Tetraodon nigroviridis]|uniref:(spotted green pufferfish) hypothetical protein n=1 Tax=Tetraodon nigroviridis TaxID=99883 RepID=Q4SQ13_TETNG|nr:unnamed protein product [Tetraodon nigroviridis]